MQGAHIAADAWWDADTTQKTRSQRTIFISQRRMGAQVIPEVTVTDIRPSTSEEFKFEVLYKSTTNPFGSTQTVRGRNVIVSAGALGTMELLFRCRDVTRSLPLISQRLGDNVRTNSENIMGVTSRETGADFSKGIAISSIFQADEVTRVEPVRYSDGSSFIRVMTAPHVEGKLPARALPEDDLGIDTPSPGFPVFQILLTLGALYHHPVGDAGRGKPHPHSSGAQYFHPLPPGIGA